MPDIADKADVNISKILEINITNRKQYGVWNKEQRVCVDCGEDIPIQRLKAINAYICIDCARDREL